MAAHHPHDDVRTRNGSGVLTVDAPGIGGGTARTDASTPDLHDDGLLAERAWRDGHTIVAIDAADRALAAGTDPGGRAAGVAAAAAAADGALYDAAARWRGVAVRLEGARGVRAAGHAALAAALAGDLDAATRDLADARHRLPDPAPRGLAVLLDGVDAMVAAAGGDFERAARHLAGLAATTVPPDPLGAERWDELAVTVLAAGGADSAARVMLGGQGHNSPAQGAQEQRAPGQGAPEQGARAQGDAPTSRHRLLAAWLDMRTGRLTQARDELLAAAGTPVLRRNAVLAAAVSVGLARRSGDGSTRSPTSMATRAATLTATMTATMTATSRAVMTATWHRVAPVVAGADVELLLLDVWGELSVGAAMVSPTDRDTIVDAMRAAVVRAGSPPWCVAAEQWWRFERAVATGDVAVAADAADRLTAAAPRHPRARVLAAAATTWAAVLAGDVDPHAVARTTADLAAADRPWEAAALCRAAAARATDPVMARELLGRCRGLVAGVTARGPATRGASASGSSASSWSASGLSEREREVGALVVDGLTHKEIGARLYISPKTVEQHVARLRQKLAAANRAALVAALRPCVGG